MGKLDDKVAVIAGANSGIGLASAARFAQEGARLHDRRQRELDAAVAEVSGVHRTGVIPVDAPCSRRDLVCCRSKTQRGSSSRPDSSSRRAGSSGRRGFLGA